MLKFVFIRASLLHCHIHKAPRPTQKEMSTKLNVLEAEYTKRVLCSTDLVEIECEGLSKELIEEMEKILGNSEMHPTVQLLHLCKTVGNLPFLLATSFKEIPKVHCATKIAPKGDNVGMVLHGPEKIAGNLAQRVLPVGDKSMNAKPPVSNNVISDGSIGACTLQFQMLYDATGGLVGDGEMCSIPSCKKCGMPTFNAIYYMYCMTQVASHSTSMDMNYSACHITAKHFASNIDDHTSHLKKTIGVCDLKNPMWVKCEECTPNIRFGNAMDIVNNKLIRGWLDVLHQRYKETIQRWFIPQRHFLCYSMNIGHKCKVSNEEIEQRRRELLETRNIHTEKMSVIDNLGIRAKICEVNPLKTRGILELTEACHLQERHDYTQSIIHTELEVGTRVSFDVNSIPCSLQGTNNRACRTFCGNLNDHVVCSIYTHPVEGLQASFVLPRDHFVINSWAKRAADSFSSNPLMLPMYCVPEDSENDILDTIKQASACFASKTEEGGDLKEMHSHMECISKVGAPCTNNLTLPVLMDCTDAPWLETYLNGNVRADSLISQGGPEDWAIPVAETLYYDTRIVSSETRDRASSELEIWQFVFEEAYPYLKASDFYRGMEKLQSAILRKMIQCTTREKLLHVTAFDRKTFRYLRDVLHRLPFPSRHANIERAIINFVERNRYQKKKKW